MSFAWPGDKNVTKAKEAIMWNFTAVFIPNTYLPGR